MGDLFHESYKSMIENRMKVNDDSSYLWLKWDN